MIRNAIKKYRSIFNVISRITNTNILNEITAENCKNNKSNERNEKSKENDKRIDNNKHADDDTSNVKFANMTSLKTSKYASMSIKKTFNNSL
jgi:hypothetical protein